ncbi:peptide-N4-(n-acetyl-beta-glucosaminyl)asparagine amidase [Fusarium heterosporum]|uniref:Peptide-N4-(N-acetyl-beta-glucosaminyl)asparagine amidase n=1 Tax=Fusarium heterosporum TaxID=42747 RepID=A0A8H5T6L3_FUSHE|nr:peptide-N4-(n-acetyl-beta-glucosaminyl)asparagine amidase [Fusarium heterosporum]
MAIPLFTTYTETMNRKNVAVALEVARESPDGVSDPTLRKLLEATVARTWHKVLVKPDYIMTREEFAVFNFFQHCFIGNTDAMSARKRYWDNTFG